MTNENTTPMTAEEAERRARYLDGKRAYHAETLAKAQATIAATLAAMQIEYARQITAAATGNWLELDRMKMTLGNLEYTLANAAREAGYHEYHLAHVDED